MIKEFGNWMVKIIHAADVDDGNYLERGGDINTPQIEFYKIREDGKRPFVASFYVYAAFRGEFHDWAIRFPDAIVDMETRRAICDWIRSQNDFDRSDDIFTTPGIPDFVRYIATDEDGITYGFCCMPRLVTDAEYDYKYWSAPECKAKFIGWFNPKHYDTVLERV